MSTDKNKDEGLGAVSLTIVGVSKLEIIQSTECENHQAGEEESAHYKRKRGSNQKSQKQKP